MDDARRSQQHRRALREQLHGGRQSAHRHPGRRSSRDGNGAGPHGIFDPRRHRDRSLPPQPHLRPRRRHRPLLAARRTYRAGVGESNSRSWGTVSTHQSGRSSRASAGTPKPHATAHESIPALRAARTSTHESPIRIARPGSAPGAHLSSA